MTTGILEQFGILKMPSRNGHGFSASTQHAGNELLRHWKFVTPHAVEAHQQPAAETIFEWMESVAYCRLRNLGKERLGIEQETALKRAAPSELL